MLRDDAVALIQQTLGFRTDLQASIITNMQLAQTNMEARPNKPWFLLSEDSTKRLTVGERRLRIPDNFLQEYEEGALIYVPELTAASDEVPLTKEDYDYLVGFYGTSAVGTPEAYSLDGYYFNVFPLADDDYLMRLKYYKRAAVLTTNIENEWLKEVPYALLGEAGLLLAPSLRGAAVEAVATFREWRREGGLLLQNMTEARMHANRTYQIGGPV